MSEYKMAARQRVARGVQLLDAHAPGWDKHIDLDLLDMQAGSCCILGQMYRSADPLTPYSTGLLALGLDDYREDGKHGFELDEHGDYDYQDLQAMWVEVIEARR